MELCEDDENNEETRVIKSTDSTDDQEMIEGLSIGHILVISGGVILLIGIILMIIWCWSQSGQGPKSHIPLGYQDQQDVIITHMTHDEVVAAHQSVTRNRVSLNQQDDETENEKVNATRNRDNIMIW